MGTVIRFNSAETPNQLEKPSTEPIPPKVARTGTTTPRSERTKMIRQIIITIKPAKMRILVSRAINLYCSVTVYGLPLPLKVYKSL